MKIGTFTKQDDSYTGTINTLSIVAEITLKPADKSSDSAPDFRVYSGDGEVGAAWNKVSKEDREYVFGSCNLTSGNSFGFCASCPTGGMPPVGRSVILLFHESNQTTMEVTKCGNNTIQT